MMFYLYLYKRAGRGEQQISIWLRVRNGDFLTETLNQWSSVPNMWGHLILLDDSAIFVFDKGRFITQKI
jgi:hypothetical protein